MIPEERSQPQPPECVARCPPTTPQQTRGRIHGVPDVHVLVHGCVACICGLGKFMWLISPSIRHKTSASSRRAETGFVMLVTRSSLDGISYTIIFRPRHLTIRRSLIGCMDSLPTIATTTTTTWHHDLITGRLQCLVHELPLESSPVDPQRSANLLRFFASMVYCSDMSPRTHLLFDRFSQTKFGNQQDFLAKSF